MKALSPAAMLAKKLKANKKSKPKKKVYKSKFVSTMPKLRKQLGLSLHQISTHSGIPYGSLQTAERGGNISIDTAMTLSKFFGKSISELWLRK